MVSQATMFLILCTQDIRKFSFFKARILQLCFEGGLVPSVYLPSDFQCKINVFKTYLIVDKKNGFFKKIILYWNSKSDQ